MGVTYKLKDEVIQFIISQRQGDPLSSCRQLAESASQKFGLHLSKSSVHDVLKESGIVTPRGRKPKDKFAIPQEKKKQIQTSLSQNFVIPSLRSGQALTPSSTVIPSDPSVILSEAKDLNKINSLKDSSAAPQNDRESGTQNDRESGPQNDRESRPRMVGEEKDSSPPRSMEDQNDKESGTPSVDTKEEKVVSVPTFLISAPLSSSTVISLPSTVIPLPSTVIPAKAGIQKKINSDMDPRFRGDDNMAAGDDNKREDVEDNKKQDTEISAEYEGAGKIFLKAAFWDLGIFSPSFFKEGSGEFNSEGSIKDTDWGYYLTYSKGIKVDLENSKSFFIDLPLPIERCIRETADGLINNVRPLIVHKVSDDVLFKACMDAQAGFKIKNVSIVDEKDHILVELSSIVDHKRSFIIQNRVFLENVEINALERAKTAFFSQHIDNNSVIDKILNLKGFDTTKKDENTVTLLIEESYDNKIALQKAIEILNGMYIRDEKGRLVKVNISSSASLREA
jgi:hypothetical protein